MKKLTSYLLAFIAVIMTMVVVWYKHQPVTPKEATWEEVMAEATAGGYKIITTQELRDRYQDNQTTLLLVDTRQEWEYRAGHIKGSVNFPMEPTWWGRFRNSDALEAFLGQDKERDIVFY